MRSPEDFSSRQTVRSTVWLLFAALLLADIQSIAGSIDFNRDVRPILSDNCLSCHGFDEAGRKAGLRLDVREGVVADLGEGKAAVIPGDPAASLLIQRVIATSPDEVMPPPESHKKPLAPDQIEVLERWIRDGAQWGEHWAFVKPIRPRLGKTDDHPIDHFVRNALKDTKLEPSQRAPEKVLTRRLAFDLTGLPPRGNLNGKRFEQQVDELLASPHFGERMAMWWLDAARYSDTDGYQIDSTRMNWPWRDWVIEAFNDNMPFDQFTVEQFAGDLLPGATQEQVLATCFHRNHMTNGEGGRDPEQSRVDYVIDRVNTLGTVWLGLTLGCTQCHDHKFDPISQQDYYGLSAYFNSIDEDGKAGGGAKPYLKFRSPYANRAVEEAASLLEESKQARENLKRRLQPEFEAWLSEQEKRVREGFVAWEPLGVNRLKSVEGSVLAHSEDNIIVASAPPPRQDDYILTVDAPKLERITGLQIEVFPHRAHTDGKYSYSEDGEFLLTNVKMRVRKQGSTQVRDVVLSSAVADVNGRARFAKNSNVSGVLDDDPRTGWTTREKASDVAHRAVIELQQPLVLGSHEELEIVLMHRSLDPGRLLARFRLSVTDQRGSAVRELSPMPLEELAADGANMDAKLRQRLVSQFLEDIPKWQQLARRHYAIEKQLGETRRAAGDLNVMVLAERQKPRKTHILLRGEWDKHGKEVSRGILPAVHDVPAELVPTRLELANWIVSPDNPLTSRVIVNQVWQLLFGAGLVRTPSDFGFQGEQPTHPELLDWLAVEFIESGWDVKHLVRTIVTSETYQQDSTLTPEALELDPQNRWLARGARYRLPSWMLRDAKLASSGLLNTAIGGPPVFPYQPEGIWSDQFMGRFSYNPSHGPAQNRRTIYAFWRRSSAPAFLFDSAMRRSCEVTPRRTNTPLQALTLLNDLTALEASRTVAESALRKCDDQSKQLEFLFERILNRLPENRELAVLQREYARAYEFYRKSPEQAAVFTRVGQLSQLQDVQEIPVAALMVVANMVFNLDEALTHE